MCVCANSTTLYMYFKQHSTALGGRGGTAHSGAHVPRLERLSLCSAVGSVRNAGDAPHTQGGKGLRSFKYCTLCVLV